jgi:hypothetical protein
MKAFSIWLLAKGRDSFSLEIRVQRYSVRIKKKKRKWPMCPLSVTKA